MHTARLSCGVLLGLSRLTQLRSASDVCMMDRAIRLYEGSSRVKRVDYLLVAVPKLHKTHMLAVHELNVCAWGVPIQISSSAMGLGC